MSTSYKVDGFDDFFDEITDMEISDTKKKKALKAVGNVLIDGIEPNLPKKTGRYRKGLKQSIRQTEEGMSVIVTSNKFYDMFQEYGTSKQKANVGSFEKGVTQSADKAVQTAIKELSR
jgi:HK97 gp10 family phage protein